MKTPMALSVTSSQREKTSLRSQAPRLPSSNVCSTRDLENPSASVHLKRFSTPSLTLKFLCAGKLNPRNDKSSAIVNYLNGFRICDRRGKKEKRSQDGVPSSQLADFAYMSLKLGGWDRRLVQDHGRLVPQLGRLGSASARGCGPCQGAARSVGVNVLDEGRPVDDLSAPFVVTGS